MADFTPNRVYLALGSNINPERNLPDAVQALCAFGRLVTASQVWEAPPADHSTQPNYLNAAVLLETSMNARDLYQKMVGRVEKLLGRKRDPLNKYAPRTIDVDIALFNHEVIRLDHRKIPDPEILKRAFLAIPLSEIDPSYVHPLQGKTLKTIAERLRQKSPEMWLRKDVVLGGNLPG